MNEDSVVSVEFALAYSPGDLDIDYELWRRPWTNLPRAQRTVRSDTSLAQAALDGARLLIPEQHRLSSLAHGGYELGLRATGDSPPVFIAELDVVDRSGRVHWGRWDWRELTFRQLLDSSEAGTLPGDPRGIALMRPGRGAGGVVTAWEAFLQVWEVLAHILQAHAVFDIAGRIEKRVRRGREAVSENLADWRLRGAMTHRFMGLLARREWQPETLGGLLGCSAAEAAATLELFGYQRTAEGGYRPGRDGAEGFLWMLAQRVQESYADEGQPNRDALDAILRAQIAQLIDSEGSEDVVKSQRQHRLP